MRLSNFAKDFIERRSDQQKFGHFVSRILFYNVNNLAKVFLRKEALLHCIFLPGKKSSLWLLLRCI
jgi:hypothetical protein